MDGLLAVYVALIALSLFMLLFYYFTSGKAKPVLHK
jgi:hypothetical protein